MNSGYGGVGLNVGEMDEWGETRELEWMEWREAVGRKQWVLELREKKAKYGENGIGEKQYLREEC